MVYAAFTGALLAAAAFAAVSSPVLADDAHGAARKAWLTGAVIVATAAFCWRVARTLRRFDRRHGADAGPDAGEDADQPPAPAGSPGPPDAAPDGTATDAPPRVPRQRRAASRDGGRPPDDQPSQPGRTSPDS
jgi:hypothetical protein